MLHRKLYQLCSEHREVCIFLRDQQRWIDGATIVDVEGELTTIRYESDEEDELCAWEEIVRIDSIGSINQKVASVPKGDADPPVSEDCPEAERIRNPNSDGDSA